MLMLVPVQVLALDQRFGVARAGAGGCGAALHFGGAAAVLMFALVQE